MRELVIISLASSAPLLHALNEAKRDWSQYIRRLTILKAPGTLNFSEAMVRSLQTLYYIRCWPFFF